MYRLYWVQSILVLFFTSEATEVISSWKWCRYETWITLLTSLGCFIMLCQLAPVLSVICSNLEVHSNISWFEFLWIYSRDLCGINKLSTNRYLCSLKCPWIFFEGCSAPKKVMDKLQHVQNALACLITGTGKYEHGLSRLMHDDLHWLVIPQWVQYKLAVTVHRCFRHRAPWYLANYCVPVFKVMGRQHLRSARCHQLSFLRVFCSTLATHAFSVTGPRVWNSPH